MTSPTAWAPMPTSTTAPRLPTRAAIAAYTLPFPQSGMMVFCEEVGFQDPYYFILQSPDAVNGTTVLATAAGGSSRWVAKGGGGAVILAGDVTGPAAANIVEKVTGVGGVLAMAATAAALTWAATTLTPTITQVNSAAAVAEDLTVRAQTTTNPAGVGGDLVLRSGGGFNAANNGVIRLFHDATEVIDISPIAGPSVAIAAGPVNYMAITATNFAGQVIFLQTAAGGSFVEVDSPSFRVGDTGGAEGMRLIGGATPEFRFATAGATPKIWQADTAGAAGADMTIAAQASSNGAGVGGDLILSVGTGLGANGDLKVVANTTATASAGASLLPATPVGFLVCYINGASQRIPYYDPP